MKIGMMQLNFTVGDFTGNADKIIASYQQLVSQGAELVVGTELALFGYPPRDMLIYPHYLTRQNAELARVSQQVGPVPLIIGVAANLSDRRKLNNSAFVIQNKLIIHWADKLLLPTYDVFDETRYFAPGAGKPLVFTHQGKRIALLICEDIWEDKAYERNPVQELADKKVDTLIVINGSPYYWHKEEQRYKLVSSIAKRLNASVVYVNQVGGNDDLVFDGHSFAVNPQGQCLACARSFVEQVMVVDLEINYGSDHDHQETLLDLYQALVMATRDYVHKTGFQKVVIGLSGGIDSALVAKIAVDALGKENVVGITMPSKFSSQGSYEDSRELASHLGIKLFEVPIKQVYNVFKATVKNGWGLPQGNSLPDENIQARIRGALLMYYSNQFGCLVLSTGNKSELSVGYCTLYGDMCGGFAVISDVPKTLVFQLAELTGVIPAQIIVKAPSAELKANQKDTDSLPPYDVLDAILHWYIDERCSAQEIISKGYKPELVATVIQMVNRAEYKRQQMAIGPKVTSKAFGSGWRFPVAAVK